MTTGVDRRSQIDTETVRALLLINGGGAIAMMALLPTIIELRGYEPLARAILVGLLILMIGLVCAVIHNRLRRMCSLHYDLNDMRPPKGKVLGVRLWAPTVCAISETFMLISIAAFFAAGAYVAIVGIVTVDAIQF